MKNYKVYMHIFPNNKVYIGITTQKVNRRWSNGKGYKNNIYMANAINKYGWDKVRHEVLAENLSKLEAEQKEIELISQYRANDRKYGYNILDGGNVSNGVNDATRKKMSNNTKELWKNIEYRQHMVKIHTGKTAKPETKEKQRKNNKKFWLGKHLTEEMKEKISKNKKGSIPWNKGTKGIMKANKTSFKKGELSLNSKKVICLETNIVYESIEDARIKTKTNRTSLSNVCNGKQNTAGGLHWKFA